jgi:predicted nuclease of predicted toxin-antitoxin system
VKLLLDECLPKGLRKHLTGHECDTAANAGFAGMSNGELLTLAERSGWQILLTMDQGMPYQQNLEGRRISIIVIRAKSNRLADLLPHVPTILNSLRSIKPSEAVKIG